MHMRNWTLQLLWWKKVLIETKHLASWWCKMCLSLWLNPFGLFDINVCECTNPLKTFRPTHFSCSKFCHKSFSHNNTNIGYILLPPQPPPPLYMSLFPLWILYVVCALYLVINTMVCYLNLLSCKFYLTKRQCLQYVFDILIGQANKKCVYQNFLFHISVSKSRFLTMGKS